jgi:hypothetical protein
MFERASSRKAKASLIMIIAAGSKVIYIIPTGWLFYFVGFDKR